MNNTAVFSGERWYFNSWSFGPLDTDRSRLHLDRMCQRKHLGINLDNQFFAKNNTSQQIKLNSLEATELWTERQFVLRKKASKHIVCILYRCIYIVQIWQPQREILEINREKKKEMERVRNNKCLVYLSESSRSSSCSTIRKFPGVVPACIALPHTHTSGLFMHV